MPLPDDTRKTRIVGQVGDSENAALAAGIDLLWSYYADLEAVSPTLRDLYTQRDAIDRVLGAGGEREQTDFRTPNIEARQSQRVTALKAMREAVQKEIERVEAQLPLAVGAAVGDIAATAIRSREDAWLDPVRVYPDANLPIYRGDPYQGTGWPKW